MKKENGLESKICNCCKIEKKLENFKKVYKKSKSEYGAQCKACINIKQTLRRKSDGDMSNKKYSKTFKGHIVSTYKNMRARILGIQKNKAHLYSGLSLMEREEFYEWAISDQTYKQLFDSWVYSDYEFRLTPSIDRIDSKEGYVLGNIRWLPHWENSQRGASAKVNIV